jgi:hypothetical protein
MEMPGLGHGGHDSVMLIAAAVLVIGGAIFLAISFRTRPARSGPAAFHVSETAGSAPTVRRSLVQVMAGLSAGVAVIHLVAAPHHYGEIGDLAAGFLVAAAFQAGWTVACLAGPSRRVMAIGVAGNLAIVLAWLYTRTIGLPVGPFAGSAEPVGFPDGASVVFELLLVAALLIRWRGYDLVLSRRAAARTAASIAVVPLVSLVIVLTSLATVAVASGLDHGAPPGGVSSGHASIH